MSAQESPTREARVEELVGRKVYDVNGKKVGRIEELVAEQQGTELVLLEVHVGPGALLERVIDLASIIPFSGPIQRQLNHLRRIPWHNLDLSDPRHPRCTVSREELKVEAP